MSGPEQAKSGRGWLVVVAACLVMFAPSYAQMQMSPIAASLQSVYGISEAQYMTVFTAPNLAPIFLSFIAGILLDRLGSKKVVLVAIAITCFGCVMRVLVSGFVPFYCVSILIGVATSFMTTGAAKIMSRFFPVEKIGVPVGIIFAASSVANLVAVATTAYFPTTAAAFTVSAVVALVATVVWAIAVPGESSSEERAGQEHPKIGPILKCVLTSRDVWLVIVANVCLGVMGFVIAGMLPTVLAARGMSVTDAGVMSAAYSLGALVGAVITPAVTAHVRNEKVFLAVLSLVLAVLFPFVMLVPLGIALGALLVVIGIISYGLVPVLLSLPVRFEKVGVEKAGTAGGLLTMLQSLGIAVLPGNVIIPAVSGDYGALFMVLSALAVITLVCALFMKIPKAQPAPRG